MVKITFEFKDIQEGLFLIENLAQAQRCIAESNEFSENTEKKDFAHIAISNIISQLASKLVEDTDLMQREFDKQYEKALKFAENN